MTVTFRPIADADVEAVVALWHTCGLVVPWNDPNRDIAAARSVADAEILLAEQDNAIVGSAMVGYDGHRGWVYYVAVAPTVRGAGIGRLIMAEVETWMKARGVPKAELMVRRSNDAVQGFYEALGWAEEPVTVRARRFDDAPTIGLGTVTTRVTALEMLARPSRPALHPPAAEQLSLVRAHEPTAAFARWLYEQVGADWTWVSRRMLSDAELLATVRDPAVEVYVLHVAGVPAGFGEIDRRAGTSGTGDVELAYFGLIPEFISRGLGWYLLNAAIDLAWDAGPCTRLWVHTCDLDHPRAIGAYQRAGFVAFDQYDETLPDPRLVGLPMPERRPGAASQSDNRPATVTPLHQVRE